MITLTTPEATPSRTRARLVAMGINSDTNTVHLRFRVEANDGSAGREVDFRINGGQAAFINFLQDASISRTAIEQAAATRFLPGQVS